MKLTKKYFFTNDGEIRIKDEGWLELRSFCTAIVVKKIGDLDEDLVDLALLDCIDRLEAYNPAKNTELGGFLYWRVRAVMRQYLRRKEWETPVDPLILRETLEENE